MKLKSQMEKQRAYAMRQRNNAKKNNDINWEYYWLGIYHAMDWALDSRDEWTYVDSETMPRDEKLEW